MHTIAAKAVMLKEALSPDFKRYAAAVVENAQALSAGLIKRGLQIVSGGTDSHLLVVDLRPIGVTGAVGEVCLDSVGITGNKNTVPFDPQPPAVCSGVRLGTPALTTRGMGVAEMEQIAALIVEALAGVGDEKKLAQVSSAVRDLSSRFPLYKHRLVGERG
jgi:glycine hydroxymethyltransferase